jgi:hypothetical protein
MKFTALSLGLLGSASANWLDASKPVDPATTSTTTAWLDVSKPVDAATTSTTKTWDHHKHHPTATVTVTKFVKGGSVCPAQPTQCAAGWGIGGYPGSPVSPDTGSGNGWGSGAGSDSGSDSGNGWGSGSDSDDGSSDGLNPNIPGGQIVGTGGEVYHPTWAAPSVASTTAAAPTYTGWEE